MNSNTLIIFLWMVSSAVWAHNMLAEDGFMLFVATFFTGMSLMMAAIHVWQVYHGRD